MGLFDGALGNLVNSAMGGGQNPAQGGNAVTVIMTLIQECGGLPKILELLNQSGLEKEVSSWIGNGGNLPISADQVQQVFSSDTIQGVASKLGVSTDEASGTIAKVLPEVVNQLTPNGSVPENHSDLLSQGLSMLKGI